VGLSNLAALFALRGFGHEIFRAPPARVELPHQSGADQKDRDPDYDHARQQGENPYQDRRPDHQPLLLIRTPVRHRKPLTDDTQTRKPELELRLHMYPHRGFFQQFSGVLGGYTPLEGHLTLAEHDFMRGLPTEQLEPLSALATEVTFAENQVVLEDGQVSSSFYLLTRGSVAVELRAPQYAVCVQALGPGNVFGWSALLDHQDTLFRVRAREHTTALRFDGEKLKCLCLTDPALGAELLRRTLQVVASRVRATEIRFAEMCGVRV